MIHQSGSPSDNRGDKVLSPVSSIPMNGEVRIPKIIHRVWVGNKEIPKEFEYNWETWRKNHPTWEFRTWRDADIPSLGGYCESLCGKCRNPAEVSDVMRFFIVEQHGGVYVDTDFESFYPIENAIAGYDFVGAFENNDEMVASAFFGAVPHHPVIKKTTEMIDVDTRKIQMFTAGPRLFTSAIGDFKNKEILIHPRDRFYPVPYGEKSKGAIHYPWAWAVHHWAHTWKQDWNTFTIVTNFPVEGLGSNDVVVANLPGQLKTTHVIQLGKNESLTGEAFQFIRQTLRNAPNYAQNDFCFRHANGNLMVLSSIQHDSKTTYVDSPVKIFS
jgi:mannosyltransferase OCH1-like enzyme